jgi:hypothetical protein
MRVSRRRLDWLDLDLAAVFDRIPLFPLRVRGTARQFRWLTTLKQSHEAFYDHVTKSKKVVVPFKVRSLEESAATTLPWDSMTAMATEYLPPPVFLDAYSRHQEDVWGLAATGSSRFPRFASFEGSFAVQKDNRQLLVLT